MPRAPAAALVAALFAGSLLAVTVAVAQGMPEPGAPSAATEIAPDVAAGADGIRGDASTDAEPVAAAAREPVDPATTEPAATTTAPASATAVAPDAAGPTPLPEAVLAYARVLAAVERADVPTSLEPLLEAGEAASAALMRIEGDRAWLERLSEADLAAARAAMRGYVLSSGDDIYALPDPAFFADLARRKGQPQDIAFFALTKQSAGENFLPLYLKDKLPTPCVRFGERIIGELYEGWRSYARQYPRAYKPVVTQNRKDLEETVVLGTCACGDTASVQNEQREFLRRFPKSPVVKDVTRRLRQLDVDPEVQPVNCR